MAVQTRGRAVHAANLGLYLDRPPLLVPERGLSAGSNFRIADAQLTNYNVGWSAFHDVNLDGKPVTLIEEFRAAGELRKLILGNTTDLFQFSQSTLSYITPRYDTGTVSVTNGSPTVTGSGTSWSANVKAGDFFALGADETDPEATWYEVDSVDSDTQITLTENYAESTDSGEAYTIRQTFTLSISSPWVSEVFRNAESVTSGSDGDRWYATNGINPVVAWDGASDQVYYPSIGLDTCAALRRYKNTMIYIAPTVSGTFAPNTIKSSAVGQPENLSTLEAAEFVVHDGSDSLITARPIGELLAIYAERAIYLAQYVGPPLMFVFRAAVPGCGTRSARGVVSFPNYHLFIGPDCQYRFDGVTALPESAHVWRDVLRRTSPNRPRLVQGLIDESNAELIWVMPLNSDTADSPEYAYVGHYLEEVGEYPTPHSLRQLPATAIGTYRDEDALTFDDLNIPFSDALFRWDDATLQPLFANVLFGTDDGDIFQLGSTTQAGTEPMSFVRFSRRPLVDSRRNGTVKRVYVNDKFEGSGDLTVNLRLFDSPNTTTVKEQAEVAIALDGTERFASFRNSARFVEVEFGSTPTTPGYWSIEGYDVDVVPGGSR